MSPASKMRPLSLFLSLAAGGAFAEPLVTDRPDIAESSEVLEARVYQWEQGGAVERAEGRSTGTFPSLHRFGLGHGVELRVETPVMAIADRHAGFEDVAVGAKWHLLDGGGRARPPSLALLGHAVVDADRRLSGIFKLAADTGLPLDFDLGVNAGATVGHAASALYAASLSHALAGPLRGYLEISGEHPLRQEGPAAVAMDLGVALLLGDDVQLDGALLRGLSAGAPDWSATVGLSTRWGARR